MHDGLFKTNAAFRLADGFIWSFKGACGSAVRLEGRAPRHRSDDGRARVAGAGEQGRGSSGSPDGTTEAGSRPHRGGPCCALDRPGDQPAPWPEDLYEAPGTAFGDFIGPDVAADGSRIDDGLARFAAFEPVFRGRRLGGHPDLDSSAIMTIGLLISDRQQGRFQLDVH